MLHQLGSPEELLGVRRRSGQSYVPFSGSTSSSLCPQLPRLAATRVPAEPQTVQATRARAEDRLSTLNICADLHPQGLWAHICLAAIP